ncbi:unnamed protein product, partial [Amoebophrya sp. A25]
AEEKAVEVRAVHERGRGIAEIIAARRREKQLKRRRVMEQGEDVSGGGSMFGNKNNEYDPTIMMIGDKHKNSSCSSQSGSSAEPWNEIHALVQFQPPGGSVEELFLEKP